MAQVTIQFDPANPLDVQHALKAVLAHNSAPLETLNASSSNTDASIEEQAQRLKEQEEADEALRQEEAEAAEAEEAKKKAAAAKRKEAAAKKKAEEEAAAAAAEAAAEETAEEEEANDGLDDEPTGPSREEVRKALKEYSALEGKEAAIKILKDHGASSMSELKEDQFEAVLKAVN